MQIIYALKILIIIYTYITVKNIYIYNYQPAWSTVCTPFSLAHPINSQRKIVLWKIIYASQGSERISRILYVMSTTQPPPRFRAPAFKPSPHKTHTRSSESLKLTTLNQLTMNIYGISFIKMYNHNKRNPPPPHSRTFRPTTQSRVYACVRLNCFWRRVAFACGWRKF